MAKSLIPLSGFFLTLQGISEVMKCLICIKEKQWPERIVVSMETEQLLMKNQGK